MERRFQRYTIWLPVQVAQLEEGVAVGHDVSARGLLMVSASKLEVGAELTVKVQLPPDSSEEREIRGRVVRVEKNQEDPDGMWPHRIALEFEDTDEEMERALKRLETLGVAKKKQ